MDAIRQKESVRQKHIVIYSTLVLLSIATVIIPLLFQTTSDAIIPAVFAVGVPYTVRSFIIYDNDVTLTLT